MTQGYIGVSCNPKERLRHHFKNAYGKYHSDKILSKAINKYGKNDLCHKILIIGNKEYCYTTEKKIRPTPFIGWNMREGGYHTPNHNPKGNKLPISQIQKAQNTMKIRRANGEVFGSQRKVSVNGIIFNSIKDAAEVNHISYSQIKRLLRQPQKSTMKRKFFNLVIKYAD